MNQQTKPVKEDEIEKMAKDYSEKWKGSIGWEYTASVGAFKAGYAAAQKSEQLTPVDGTYEGGWKYDPDWLKELTEKVNRITDYEETVSMEQAEAVLLTINYPKYNSTPTPLEAGKPDRLFTMDEMRYAYISGYECCDQASIPRVISYFKETFGIDINKNQP